MLQETRFQVQVLKPYKSIQESSEEVLFIKAWQLTSIKVQESCFSSRLDNYSTNRVSVEIYKVQYFRADFHPIYEYMFELSFLTTLNIYKDYFKGRKRLWKLHKSTIPQVWRKVWPKTYYVLVLLSLEEAAVFVHHRIL